MRRILSVIVITALSLTAVPVVRAQAVHVQVTPFIGGLVPTSALGTIRMVVTGSSPTNVKTEMKSAVAFGGRLDVYSRGRFGLQALYFHSNTGVRTIVAALPVTRDAVFQGGSIKVNYQATSAQTGTDLVLSGGVAGLSHSGQAFAINGNRFNVGGDLGAGLHVVMTPNVTLRFDADMFVHRFSSAPAVFPATTQVDMLITAGLAFKLGR